MRTPEQAEQGVESGVDLRLGWSVKRGTRRWFALAALLAAGVCLLLLLEKEHRRQALLRHQSELALELESLRRTLHIALQAHLGTAEAAAAFLLASPSFPDRRTFDILAPPLLARYHALRALCYADSQWVVRYCYPSQDHESLVGRNLHTQPDGPLIARAIRQRQTTVSDPELTAHGDLHLRVHVPLVRADRCIGLTQAVLDLKALLEETRSGQADRFLIQLRGTDGRVFWGAEELEAGYMSAKIPVANSIWSVRLGWRVPPPTTDRFVMGLIWGGGLALLASLLVMVNGLWTWGEALEKAVIAKTHELDDTNRELQAEIAERKQAQETERHLKGCLQALQEVGHQLMRVSSSDELCRQAVEMGRSRLGFDRLAIWFVEQGGDFMRGCFGTDEQGELRDERQVRRRIDPHLLIASALTEKRPLWQDDIALHNHLGEAVGQGWQAIAPLWDGEQVIGGIIADNLLGGRPRESHQLEILLLYGVMLGHLCTLKRREEGLQRSSERLKALTLRLQEAEETERRRLARELHDQVSQNLTAISLALSLMLQSDPPLTADQQNRLHDLLRLVQETLGPIRDVMGALRPSVLDDYGLAAALRWYGERFVQRTGIPVRLQVPDLTSPLPLPLATACFRIAQEALTNVAKHARARHATVELKEEPAGTICLTISDDGIGFDPASLEEQGEAGGWGLMTMRERAEAMGGHLQVEARPGAGTRVTLRVGRPP